MSGEKFEHSRSGDLHEYRITALEKAYLDVSITLKSIDQTLKAQITIGAELEHLRKDLNRAASDILDAKIKHDTLAGAVADMGLKMPTLMLTSKWVLMFVVGICALVGVAAGKIILTPIIKAPVVVEQAEKVQANPGDE